MTLLLPGEQGTSMCRDLQNVTYLQGYQELFSWLSGNQQCETNPTRVPQKVGAQLVMIFVTASSGRGLQEPSARLHGYRCHNKQAPATCDRHPSLTKYRFGFR